MQRSLCLHSVQLLCLVLGSMSAGCTENVPQHAPFVLVGDVALLSEEAPPERRLFAAGAQSVLYLNFDGGQITCGSRDSSSSNTSGIGGGTVPPFAGDQSVRDVVVQTVKELYRDFNVRIVATRPLSGEYGMVMIGGTPLAIGQPSTAGGGLAPLDCGNQRAQNIGFVFSEVDYIKKEAPGPRFATLVGETAAHESGHFYGLPHSGDGCDLMSYLPCEERKTFLDRNMPMQGDSYLWCGLTSMNSHQLLLTALGPAPLGPRVSIASPADGAAVATHVAVEVTIDGNPPASSVELLVDGKSAGKLSAAPFLFDITVEEGTHVVTASALDAVGNEGSSAITITAAAAASAAGPPPSLEEQTMRPACSVRGTCTPAPGTEHARRPEANTGSVTDDAPAITPDASAPGAVADAASAANAEATSEAEQDSGCSLASSKRAGASWAFGGLALLGLLIRRCRAQRP